MPLLQDFPLLLLLLQGLAGFSSGLQGLGVGSGLQIAPLVTLPMFMSGFNVIVLVFTGTVVETYAGKTVLERIG